MVEKQSLDLDQIPEGQERTNTPNINFDEEESQKKNQEIRQEVEKSREGQGKQAEKLQKFCNSYLNKILAIKESLKHKEDISQNIKFLKKSEYKEKTKKSYDELFKKLEKLFEELKLDDIGEKIKQMNIKELSNLKKKIDESKLIKYYQKLKKYENGEYINLPNGLSYELCKKSEEEKNGKAIPIPLGENEYFIKTHVNESADYTEYVSSLLEIRKLLLQKGIKIKYCKRCTRLTNREFIETYEAERKKRKGNEYKKSTGLKVLEDTEKAKIHYKIDDDSDPSRFIRKGTNLWNYIKDHKDSFKEAEMWLDLDKLQIPSNKQGKESSIIGKIKLKIQERFTRLKRDFSRK